MEFIGIVIRLTPFRDHDAMVTVLSNDKIRSFLARGVLKYDSKLAHVVNIYSKSRFQIGKGKDGYVLRNGELLNSFQGIKDDIYRLGVLDFVGEITNKMIQGSDASLIYPFFERTLELLDQKFSPYTLANIYFAKVLNVSGYSLNVDSCSICGKKDQIVGVSYNDGGFICEHCFSALNHIKMPAIELKIIRYIFKVDVDNFGKVEFDKNNSINVLKVLNSFLEYASQTKLTSIELLTKI